MKLFLKIITGIISTGSAIGIIIYAYAWGESLKPQPITKQDVKEIVKTEMAPIKVQNDSLIYAVKLIKLGQGIIVIKQDTLIKKFVRHVVTTDKNATKIDIMNLQDDLLNIKKNDESFGIR
jgi:hypothetical protein